MLGLDKNSIWRNASPTGAIADFREVYRQAGGNRFRIAIAAAATTLGLFYALTHESWRVPPAKPKITYINSWPKDRTPAETRASIARNQQQKEQRLAYEAKTAEEIKDIYRALGRASGMDVDAIDRRAKADASAAAAAEAEKLKKTAPLVQNVQN